MSTWSCLQEPFCKHAGSNRGKVTHPKHKQSKLQAFHFEDQPEQGEPLASHSEHGPTHVVSWKHRQFCSFGSDESVFKHGSAICHLPYALSQSKLTKCKLYRLYVDSQ